MIFAPTVTGRVEVRSRPDAFLSAFRSRVEQGLLTGRPHPRSVYTVTRSDADGLAFGAADRKTAFNVGLNRVELRLEGSGRLRYRIDYWEWAKYALLLSGGIGAALAAALLSVDLPRYVATHRNQMLPWLSVGGNVAAAWGMVIFWGACWPWLLVALHKGPVRRLFERIVAEVDATASRD